MKRKPVERNRPFVANPPHSSSHVGIGFTTDNSSSLCYFDSPGLPFFRGAGMVCSRDHRNESWNVNITSRYL